MMEKLQVVISSASCGEFRGSRAHKVIFPSPATAETVRRVGTFRDGVAPFFGPENVSVSLHAGFATDIPLAGKLYNEAGIAISSLDIPDIVPVTETIQKVLKDGILGNVGLVKRHVGWGLQNVPSQASYDTKISQGLGVLASNDSPRIVRTNAKSFFESRAGILLRNRLLALPKAVLAVEIDAEHQTPAEYLEFLQKINHDFVGAPVVADLDLGHLGRSRFIHRNRSEIPQPKAILDNILADPRLVKILALVSLNQYQEGQERTHEGFLGGSIDFSEVTKKLAQASKAGLLKYPPMVLAEFYPMEYSAMLSEDGLKIWRKMAHAYYS